MSPSEFFLKHNICPNCHMAILRDHPEEKFKLKNYKKCPSCGYARQDIIVRLEIHKILGGKKDE